MGNSPPFSLNRPLTPGDFERAANLVDPPKLKEPPALLARAPPLSDLLRECTGYIDSDLSAKEAAANPATRQAFYQIVRCMLGTALLVSADDMPRFIETMLKNVVAEKNREERAAQNDKIKAEEILTVRYEMMHLILDSLMVRRAGDHSPLPEKAEIRRGPLCDVTPESYDFLCSLLDRERPYSMAEFDVACLCFEVVIADKNFRHAAMHAALASCIASHFDSGIHRPAAEVRPSSLKNGVHCLMMSARNHSGLITRDYVSMLTGFLETRDVADTEERTNIASELWRCLDLIESRQIPLTVRELFTERSQARLADIRGKNGDSWELDQVMGKMQYLLRFRSAVSPPEPEARGKRPPAARVKSRVLAEVGVG